MKAEDEVKYNIYRSRTDNFSDLASSEVTLIAEGITEKFFYDYNLAFEDSFYYNVTAVRNFGTTEAPVWREGHPALFSSEATMIDDNEFDKRLGLEDYWKYTGFVTGKRFRAD